MKEQLARRFFDAAAGGVHADRFCLTLDGSSVLTDNSTAQPLRLLRGIR